MYDEIIKAIFPFCSFLITEFEKPNYDNKCMGGTGKSNIFF